MSFSRIISMIVLSVIAFAAVLVLSTISARSATLTIAGPNGPLEGELLLSKVAQHIVIIHPGSGPINRDGNGPAVNLSTNSYKMLAEALKLQGISSLRVDKRGFFGSSKAIQNPNDVTIDAYAADTLQWVKRAAEYAPCVWIAGHSEGGLVGLVAAQENPENLCGLILMATPGRPVGELLFEQLEALPHLASARKDIKIAISSLEAGTTIDQTTLPASLRPLFSSGVQRFMMNLFSFKPAQLARNWKGPALILQGNADRQVQMKDTDYLHNAMPQSKNVILDGATHMLKLENPNRPFATYQDPTIPLHPKLVPAIAHFLNKN